MKILLFILIGLLIIPLGGIGLVLLLTIVVGAATFYVGKFIYNIFTGKI